MRRCGRYDKESVSDSRVIQISYKRRAILRNLGGARESPKRLPQQGTLIALSENSQVLLPKVFPCFLFFSINFRVILRSGPLMWHSLCRHFVLHLITHFVLHLMTEGGGPAPGPKILKFT